MLASHLPLRYNDGRRFEEENVVGLVVVQVGGVEDGLLEAGVILADVHRRSRDRGSSFDISQHQRHLCRDNNKTISNIIPLNNVKEKQKRLKSSLWLTEGPLGLMLSDQGPVQS